MRIFRKNSMKPTPPLKTKSPVNMNTKDVVAKVAITLKEIALTKLLLGFYIFQYTLLFLNTNQNTSMGPGVNLPIGDSFWMYDNPEIADHAFSYFKDLQGNISSTAPVIRDFIKAGIIDVMHSYGNFSAIGDFSRKIALQAIEELERQGLKISVWTNHGGIESIQNIGPKSYGKGDISDTIFYHSDFLKDYGIKFYWDSEISLMANVGQDCSAQFSEAYWKSPIFHGVGYRFRSALKGVLTISDNFIHRLINKHFIHWEAFNKNQNELITLDTLRDNTLFYKFKRVGLGRFDWSEDLPLLLNQQVLNKLIDKNGYLILYIHLGDRRTNDDKLPLTNQTIKTLQNIAKLYHSGKLWVTTTSRLLKYNLIFKTLDWLVKENSKKIQIFINRNLSQLNNYDLTEADLAGLTFYVPDDKNIELYFSGKPVNFQVNGIDSKGIKSISLPMSKIEWPL